MPFDWLHPRRVRRPSQRKAVYRREIEERAALLRRLNFDRAWARKRLLDNIGWDFEIGAGPPLVDVTELDAILDHVWMRGGPTAGGPPSL